MELRSGRPLGFHPLPCSQCRCKRLRCRWAADSDSIDRISALPDDLLQQILFRLRCARSAALTSALSRRWRGLWRHLPELSFYEIAPAALDAALQQVARSALSILEIDVPYIHRDQIHPARISALLRAAARLAPAALVFSVWGNFTDAEIPIEIPCFDRATSIKLEVRNLYLTPPANGLEFPVLERLSVTRCRFDINEFIQRCPRLRVLEARDCWLLGKIRVHSLTIQELVVDQRHWVDGIDIMAPMLKQLMLSTGMTPSFSVSFFAPMVENLSWDCECSVRNVGIGELWRLSHLSLRKEDGVCTLRLAVYARPRGYALDVDRSFSQEISSLPNFSDLEIHLVTMGHIFAPVLLNLLGNCTAIQKLMVDVNKFTGKQVCPSNCPCEQPHDWRNQTISLPALEEAAIQGFEGTGDEIDFLKLLFRCTPVMKTMTMALRPKALPTSEGCKKIYSIFRENPSVECRVYRYFEKEVLYS